MRFRQLRGKRTGNFFSLYGCRRCHSLFNPSGYREDDATLQKDMEFLLSYEDANCKRAEVLVGKLKSILPEAETFMDLGCGTGTLVKAAKDASFKSTGIDLNPYTVNYGKKCGLDLLCTDLTMQLWSQSYDIITCTHVLEHLERPRELFEAALGILNRPGLIFLSMPFRLPAVLQILYILFPRLHRTPFYDNDVHITHFSLRSIRLWAKEYGAKCCIYGMYGWDGFILYFK